MFSFTKRFSLSILLSAALAGCGSSTPTTHTAVWFTEHAKTLKKDEAWCGKHADKTDSKLCQAVYNAQAEIDFS